MAAQGAELAHPRFGSLQLHRRAVPPYWECPYYFAPADREVALRLQTTSQLDGPTVDQCLFVDVLERRFGLAIVMLLPPIKRALQHYVRTTVLRNMLDEFTLTAVTVPPDPCVPGLIYEFGYVCVSDPTLSFVAMFHGPLSWPPPKVQVRVDRLGDVADLDVPLRNFDTQLKPCHRTDGSGEGRTEGRE